MINLVASVFVTSGVFTITPYLGIFIAAIMQTALCGIMIVFPSLKDKSRKKQELNNNRMTFRFFRSLGRATIFIFGLMCLDVGFGWIFGPWIKADWKFQIPTVILCLVCGLVGLFTTILKRPNKLDLIYAAISIVILPVSIHLGVPLIGRVSIGFILSMGISSLLQFGYLIVWFIEEQQRKRIRSNSDESIREKSDSLIQPCWDISTTVDKILPLWVMLILYVLTITEAMLKVMGTSLLLW